MLPASRVTSWQGENYSEEIPSPAFRKSVDSIHSAHILFALAIVSRAKIVSRNTKRAPLRWEEGSWSNSRTSAPVV